MVCFVVNVVHVLVVFVYFVVVDVYESVYIVVALMRGMIVVEETFLAIISQFSISIVFIIIFVVSHNNIIVSIIKTIFIIFVNAVFVFIVAC